MDMRTRWKSSFVLVALAFVGASCRRPTSDAEVSPRSGALDQGSAAPLQNVQSIAVGISHACALLNDGSVLCWGSNTFGQLGDGTNFDSESPVAVVGLNNVVSLGLGYGTSCALLADQTVSCWGSNQWGQLGAVSMASSSTPVAVLGLSGVSALVTAANNNCAVLVNHTVRCWGETPGGGRITVPMTVSLTGVVSMALGNGYGCAIVLDGTTWCTDGFSPTTGPSFAVVPGLTGAVLLAVGSGTQNACAVLTDGTVRCWGDNLYGQLGNATASFSMTPVVVPGLTGVRSLAAGGVHVCADLNDGTARCWGYNSDGELGNGGTANSLTPVVVSGLAGASSLAGGAYNTCAAMVDGTARCWGTNSLGQLGIGSPVLSAVPQAVSGLAGVASLTATFSHTCVVLSDGTARCWGENVDGELGDGTTSNYSATPVVVSGLTGVASLATGAYHTCAALSDGTVKCWGDNQPGLQPLGLGNGNLAGTSTPVAVPGLTGIISLAASVDDTCAVRNDGTAWCWGQNFSGQLGNGSTAPSLTPAIVPGLTNVASIAMGQEHTCAALTDGSVECWGDNYYGELGNGMTTSSLTPVVVPGLTGVASLAASSVGTCAALVDGTVQCWGRLAGATGGPSTPTTPEVIPELTNVVSLAGGLYHMCALLNDGTARCWGTDNFGGDLGTGNEVITSQPQQVLGLTGIVSVAAGQSYSCAALNDGSVWCWGSDGSGDLGRPFVAFSTTPVVVLGQRVAGDGGVDANTSDGGVVDGVASDGALEEAATTKALGDPCAPNDGCPSPYLCVDGVCCENDCGGGDPNDCQACSTNAGGQKNGMCTPASQTTSCKAPGDCADFELCDGTSRDCPGTAFLPMGAPCGGTPQKCEQTRTCGGFGPDCDMITYKAAGSICDSSSDPCIGDSTCTGAAPGTCPALQPVSDANCAHATSTGAQTVTLNGGATHPGGVTITFLGGITSPGRIGLKASDSTLDQSPAPDRYQVLGPPGHHYYWDIQTDAQYVHGVGNIKVCVYFDKSWITDQTMLNQTYLEHWDAAGLGTNVGTFDASDPNEICGYPASLSPFALVAPSAGAFPVLTAPAAVTAEATGPGGAKVSYSVTAQDPKDGPLAPVCVPASGSTFVLGTTMVTCKATDLASIFGVASFTVTVTYGAPTDGTFFQQPINSDSSSIFKAGSTIPVKFQLTGASAAVSNAVARLYVARISSGITGTYVEAVTNGTADSGNLFRSNGPGQYIYNLSTKGMAAGTWNLRVDLGDGVVHQVNVSLKP
jgi:alpha-tubulin suppressor-like RCC1 family protein